MKKYPPPTWAKDSMSEQDLKLYRYYMHVSEIWGRQRDYQACAYMYLKALAFAIACVEKETEENKSREAALSLISSLGVN